jgi:uracil-DNA glycosylase
MNQVVTAGPQGNLKLDESWRQALQDEFSKPYMGELRSFLKSEMNAGHSVYPRPSQFFAALDAAPLPKIKCVILGQDPYHGPGQAHGLSFSVPAGVPLPPSLQNIFKELRDDLGDPGAGGPSGCLSGWARQGVLLLNATLSVRAGQAGSHQNRGWEAFTDKVIQVVNDHRDRVVFVLWGSFAQKKGQIIDRKKHLVLESPHPSPLSAYRGFFGSKPFSKVNEDLVARGLKPIDWRVTD